jgi:transcriptional regulator with XRE-family HTH domain
LINDLSSTSFGEHLRQLREKNNFTLRALAIEINIDSSLIAKIERSERQPTRDQIKIISEFFKINENNLLVENLSDVFAYKVIEADLNIDVLKLAEQKIEYLKKKK